MKSIFEFEQYGTSFKQEIVAVVTRFIAALSVTLFIFLPKG